jgi:hypothetical protein
MMIVGVQQEYKGFLLRRVNQDDALIDTSEHTAGIES